MSILNHRCKWLFRVWRLYKIFGFIFLLTRKKFQCNCDNLFPWLNPISQIVKNYSKWQWYKMFLNGNILSRSWYSAWNFLYRNFATKQASKHILNVACALCFQVNLPIHFWGDCALTTWYLINCTPTIVLNQKSSYELLYGTPPALNHLRVLGYVRPKKKIRKKENT